MTSIVQMLKDSRVTYVYILYRQVDVGMHLVCQSQYANVQIPEITSC